MTKFQKKQVNFYFLLVVFSFSFLVLSFLTPISAQSPTLATTPTPLTTQIPKEKSQEIRDLVQEMVQEKIQEIKEKGKLRGYVGEILSFDGLEITLEARRGKKEVALDEEVTIIGPGKKKIDLEDLEVGDVIICMGNVDSEGLPDDSADKMIARRIVVVSEPLKPPQPRQAVFGKVAEADEEELTLTLTSPQKENSTLKIETTSKTQITKKVEGLPADRQGKIQKIKFAEIELNDRVVAVGTWDEDDEILTAKLIHMIPSKSSSEL